MANISTGIISRPAGTTTLNITITNNTANLVYQTISIYSYNNNVQTLVNVKSYFVQANSNVTYSFLLVNTLYGESYSIDSYELVYGPTTANVSVTFNNV